MTTKTQRFVFAQCLALALPAFSLMAQQAPSAPAAPASPAVVEEDTVLLSPFVVDGKEDANTYQATATLAGTRIRTDLKDVGSAISVVTSKFMQDIGATDNQSLLKYTTGTEVGGVGGNFTGTGNSREVYENGLLLRPNNNTRVRGLSQADNTRDFFLTDIPWDGYNIGRVDIQRGPNAILFGMGSPAGIINNSTNPASFKDEAKVETRFDNEGSYRGSLDVNSVILKKELAVRFAAVSDHTKFRQKPAFSNDGRVYGAVKYTPSFLKKNGMETSFRANFEHGDIHSNRPRSLTPVDEVTPWFTTYGKTLYNPIKAWRYDAADADSGQAQMTKSDGSFNPSYANLGAYGNIFGNPVAIFAPGAQNNSTFRDLAINAYWGISKDANVSSGNLAKATANNYFGTGGWTYAKDADGNAILNPDGSPKVIGTGAWDGGIGGVPFSRMVGIPSYANYMNGRCTGEKNPDGSFKIGSAYTALDAYKDRTLTDAGIFDFYNNLLDGPNKREWRGFESSNLALSQSFFHNRVGLEAVYDKQRYHDGQMGSTRQVLAVDINTVYLDGTANPNAGKAFVQSDTTGSQYSSESKAARLTAFGEFRAEDFFSRGKLTEIIGRHVFTGMYAEETKDTKSLSFVTNGMDAKYAYDVAGNEEGSSRIDNANLQVVNVSYLSDSLVNISNASSAHIQPITVVQTPNTLNGSIYRFDSHWNRSTDHNAPDFVDPSAPWPAADHPGSDGDTQSDNPANYKGWGNYNVGKILSYDEGQHRYYNGQINYRKVKSQAYVWQGYLLADTLVPSIGWRRDVFKGKGMDAIRDPKTNQVNPDDPAWTIDKSKLTADAGESISYSVVGHLPKFIKAKLPYGASFSVFYNRSQNFQPRPGEVDMFGNTLANPSGKTKDYGFVASVLDERLSLKVNWYETKVQNDRLNGFAFWKINQFAQTLLASAYRVNHKDMANTWKWDYGTQWGGSNTEANAREQAKADAGAALVLSAYDTNPVYKKFVDGWGLKPYFTNEYAWSNMPAGLNATTDTTSKGVEFELNARVTSNWNLALNASKTTATQNNIGGALKQWVEAMTPMATGPAGDLRQWWAGDNNNFRAIWSRDIMSQFNLLKLQEGSNVPELRPWRYNIISDYSFKQGLLKGSNVGVAYRWEDSVVIGYPIKSVADTTTGLTDYSYDISKPFKGPTESHVDLWVGYGHSVTRKINWRIQLNVRDVLAKKKLIPISCNPDGTGAAYRLPELTSWSVTNTFSF